MTNKGMNLFIVDSNKQQADQLENALYNRFGTSLNISTYYTGEICLKKVDQSTQFVILSYFFSGANGNEILKSIKAINPKTEVIMLSSNDEIITMVESYRQGATDYIVRDDMAWRKIVPHIYRKVSEPIRRLGKEYGPLAYIAMFLIAFTTVGIGSYSLMKLFSY